MPSNRSKTIALGGMLAAVAMVIMCLGGLIPIATYICTMLCTMTQFLVLKSCGRRIGWAWFLVVSVLSLLLSPDKEAAMVFLAVGYYPLIKRRMDGLKASWIFKAVFFNISVLLCYSALIYLFGMQELVDENAALGMAGLVVILLLGNITFFLLDRLLAVVDRKLR